jgi:hypothetical protein
VSIGPPDEYYARLDCSSHYQNYTTEKHEQPKILLLSKPCLTRKRSIPNYDDNVSLLVKLLQELIAFTRDASQSSRSKHPQPTRQHPYPMIKRPCIRKHEQKNSYVSISSQMASQATKDRDCPMQIDHNDRQTSSSMSSTVFQLSHRHATTHGRSTSDSTSSWSYSPLDVSAESMEISDKPPTSGSTSLPSIPPLEMSQENTKVTAKHASSTSRVSPPSIGRSDRTGARHGLYQSSNIHYHCYLVSSAPKMPTQIST